MQCQRSFKKNIKIQVNVRSTKIPKQLSISLESTLLHIKFTLSLTYKYLWNLL